LVPQRGVTQVGIIHLFQDCPETGNQHVEHRIVTFEERGVVVSQILTAGSSV
jgi:hypothetical protein